MSKLLTSKYPILCSPMNRVSEKNLAIACSKAGIFPSVISLSYIESESLKNAIHDIDDLKSDMLEIKTLLQQLLGRN